MPRGGARYDETGKLLTGRKEKLNPMVKITIRIRQDQADSLPIKGKNKFIRDAIDGKLAV